MEIILDTNFVIYLFRYKLIDSLVSLRPSLVIVPDCVVSELNKLIKTKKGRDRESAKLGLMLIDRLKSQKMLSVVQSSSKYTDDALFDLAMEKNDKGIKVLVATLDKWLIKKLKKAKIGILGIRQKKYLIIY